MGWAQTNMTSVPRGPLMCCVSLGMSLPLSGPYKPKLENGDTKTTHSTGLL